MAGFVNTVVKAGTVDVSVVVRIIDSTDGTPETGVVFNTSGIDMEYRREGAASVDITEATLAALTTAHSDGGFLHIGNGYYRLDLPDAAVAAGATGVLVHGTVTGMVVIGTYIELVAYDPYDAVRLGLTTLPNAAAEASGGLFTRGTGPGQITQATNGQIDVDVKKFGATTVTGRDLGSSVLLSSGTGTGQLSFTSGVVQADAAKVGGQTASAAGTVTFPGTVASATNITAGTITTVTNLTNAPTAGDLTATMKTSVGTAVSTELNTTIADSIPADGTIPSVRQALYMLVQYMLERSVSGVTTTVHKADGTTALYTLTLDSATLPTSTTRAT